VLHEYYAPDGGWQASRTPKGAAPQTKTKGGALGTLAVLDRYFAASRPAPGARVLDFGCGTGTWLNSFQDHGWDTFGVEPSSDAAFARHQRLSTIPSEPQFDLVIAYHVLEHLPRPLDALRQLSRAMRPHAHCFVSVPRLDTLAVHRQVDYCLHPRNHIVGFTEACLRGLLARASLGVVAVLYELDHILGTGEPLRLRMLARKTGAPDAEPDPAAALRPVIEAFVAVNRSA
jgi:SAM-dependent methyltransferase